MYHHDTLNTISVEFDEGGILVPIETTSINPDKYIRQSYKRMCNIFIHVIYNRIFSFTHK